MVLPSSGDISFSMVNVEVGAAATTQRTLLAIDQLIKPAQRGTFPNMAQLYSKAWYRKTNDGNCTVNCPANTGLDEPGGNINSGTNCIPTGTVNCVNCDTQNWLQANCNCGPAFYNCTYRFYTFNCDCDCACDCACR